MSNQFIRIQKDYVFEARLDQHSLRLLLYLFDQNKVTRFWAYTLDQDQAHNLMLFDCKRAFEFLQLDKQYALELSPKAAITFQVKVESLIKTFRIQLDEQSIYETGFPQIQFKYKRMQAEKQIADQLDSMDKIDEFRWNYRKRFLKKISDECGESLKTKKYFTLSLLGLLMIISGYLLSESIIRNNTTMSIFGLVSYIGIIVIFFALMDRKLPKIDISKASNLWKARKKTENRDKSLTQMMPTLSSELAKLDL